MRSREGHLERCCSKCGVAGCLIRDVWLSPLCHFNLRTDGSEVRACVSNVCNVEMIISTGHDGHGERKGALGGRNSHRSRGNDQMSFCHAVGATAVPLRCADVTCNILTSCSIDAPWWAWRVGRLRRMGSASAAVSASHGRRGSWTGPTLPVRPSRPSSCYKVSVQFYELCHAFRRLC